MRVTVADHERARSFAAAEVARPRTGAEWRAELLGCGLMVDLGDAGGEPIRAIQHALRGLLSAEERLLAIDQPAPWSVGGVPPAAWAFIAGTWFLLTEVWDVLVGIFGGAVLLGAVAIVGLLRHRREQAVIGARVRVARGEVDEAGGLLRARVLGLEGRDFPVVTAIVRIEAK